MLTLCEEAILNFYINFTVAASSCKLAAAGACLVAARCMRLQLAADDLAQHSTCVHNFPAWTTVTTSRMLCHIRKRKFYHFRIVLTVKQFFNLFVTGLPLSQKRRRVCESNAVSTIQQ
jgi:hypothetical protein